jgi:integrase
MIFKRGKSPYYSYRFMYKGGLYCESTRQKNKKDAEAIEAAKRSELARGVVGIYDRKPAPTLEEFCTGVFEKEVGGTRGGSIREKTWDDFYMTGIRALKGYEPLASARLDDITVELVGQFAAWRRNQGQSRDSEKPELAVATVNSSLRVLRRILNLALSKHNPSQGRFFLPTMPDYKLLKGENHRDRVLSVKDEIAYLSKAGDGSLLADFATVLFDTAMRPEECYRLRWESITWEGGLPDDACLRVAHGKTDCAQRTIPLSPRVLAVLQTRWQVAGKPQEGWVWPGPTASGHVEPSTFKKRHAKTCKEAGIRPFVFYDCRHTSLTRLGCSGADAWTFARLAGHSNVKMSERYVHSAKMESPGWWGSWNRQRQGRYVVQADLERSPKTAEAVN